MEIEVQDAKAGACERDVKSARLSPPSPSTSPSPKRSRRSIQKRVVSVPIGEGGEGPRGGGKGGGGASECAPPSDSWAWRKYGQKPIKGSPYPRGYYRCSSSKGCPARKQVERSRLDPTVLLVTYTCEHNHPWPLPKNHHATAGGGGGAKQQAAIKEEPEACPEAAPSPDLDPDPDQATRSSPESAGEEAGSRFSDLLMIEEDSAAAAMMMPDDFWYSDVGSTSSASPPPPSDTLLLGSIFVETAADLASGESGDIGGFKDDEDDAMFAGLGELPEYSTVFRRNSCYLPVQTAVHQ